VCVREREREREKEAKEFRLFLPVTRPSLSLAFCAKKTLLFFRVPQSIVNMKY